MYHHMYHHMSKDKGVESSHPGRKGQKAIYHTVASPWSCLTGLSSFYSHWNESYKCVSMWQTQHLKWRCKDRGKSSTLLPAWVISSPPALIFPSTLLLFMLLPNNTTDKWWLRACHQLHAQLSRDMSVCVHQPGRVEAWHLFVQPWTYHTHSLIANDEVSSSSTHHCCSIAQAYSALCIPDTKQVGRRGRGHQIVWSPEWDQLRSD